VLGASKKYVPLVVQKSSSFSYVRKILFIIPFNYILYKVVFETTTILHRFQLSKYVSSGLANEYVQNGEIHASNFNKIMIVRIEYNSKVIDLIVFKCSFLADFTH